MRPWTRGITLALSRPQCAFCYGLGLVDSRAGLVPCGCVHRAIFDICNRRYRSSAIGYATVTTERETKRSHWSNKEAEFCADFVVIARRVLHGDEYRLFCMHILEDNDWKWCAPRLGLDRGRFFHLVYAVKERLGRAFYETVPYSLFPIDDYFTRRDVVSSSLSPAPARRVAANGTGGITRPAQATGRNVARLWPRILATGTAVAFTGPGLRAAAAGINVAQMH